MGRGEVFCMCYLQNKLELCIGILKAKSNVSVSMHEFCELHLERKFDKMQVAFKFKILPSVPLIRSFAVDLFFVRQT